MKYPKLLLGLFFLNINLLSCAATAPTVFASISERTLPSTSPSTPPTAVGPLTQGTTLSLEQALQRARDHSPLLRAAQAQLLAQSERVEVSGRLADPEFSIRLEESPLSSSGPGGDTLIGIRQPFSISGQQNKQQAVASARLHTLQLHHDRLAMELEGEIRGLFATALSLQQALSINTKLAAIANAMDILMRDRVAAGDAVPANRTRTVDRLAQREGQVQEMRSNLKVAQQKLFAKIGIRESTTLLEEMSTVLHLPDLLSLQNKIQTLPVVAEAQSQAQMSHLMAILAESNKIPTVNLELFYRQKDTGNSALDAGILFGLPLSGRATAEHRAAKAEVEAAMQQGRLRQQETLIEIERRHAALARALEQMDLLQSKFIPSGGLRLATIEAQLQAGEISLAEVLPVREQTALLELARLDAWHRIMTAWAELSGITHTTQPIPRE